MNLKKRGVISGFIVLLLIVVSIIVSFTLIAPFVFAHEGEDENIISHENGEDQNIIDHGNGEDHEDEGLRLKWRAAQVLFLISIFVLILVLISIIADHRRTEHTKWILFAAIAIPVIAATVYVASTTVYVNQLAATKGPVHWHADFEIWNCGKKLDLVNPSGMANRVGSSLFHEHGDNRIHVEGVPLELEKITLHHFFETVGGKMTENELMIPTTEEIVSLKSGNLCKGREGKLQIFVYSVANPEEKGHWQYQQRKITPITDYLLSPHSQIPPGDCIIIEFAEEKKMTENVCESYRLAQEQGELEEFHGR